MSVRKFMVGLAVLAALLVGYLLYAQLGGTPPVELDLPEPPPGPIFEPDADTGDGSVGSVAGVGIGTLKQTRLFHTNDNQQVDRELGFEELHEDGEQWEMTNPFMKLFLPEFRCDVTADRGTFQIETAFGKLMPNDAVFQGNVVIHIVPPEPNDPMECFIYLDDVAFVADQSLFSSNGAVKFVSRSAALQGTGMELIYDGARQRLELFRVTDLHNLRLRSAAIGSLSSVTAPGEGAPQTDTGTAAVEPAGAETVPSPEQEPVADDNAGDDDPNAPGRYYRCVFQRNVRIETPEQFVLARDRLSINNILWEESGDEDAAPERPAAPVGPNEPEIVPIPGPNALDTTVSTQIAFDAIPEEFYDIVVTCDGGFVVAPTDSTRVFGAPGAVTPAETAADAPAQEETASPGRQRALAQRIDYDVPTGDTTLAGPVDLTFYIDPNGLGGRSPAGELVPMRVTARRAVRFLAASKEVLFEGDCVARVEQDDAEARYEYTLMAPMFTLGLDVAPAEAGAETKVTVARFAAHGGAVSLVVLKRLEQELAGWTGFEASRMDYEAERQLFTAYGPGVVTIHNARAADPPPEPNEISLKRPCYARLRDFDLLTFSGLTNKIVAEAGALPIRIDYVPMEDGEAGEAMHADAGYFEVTLRVTTDDRRELDWLMAADGITYWDDTNRFAGGRLTYDHADGRMTIVGDSVQPCYLNGALVDEIEWNLKTGRLKGEIPDSSTVHIGR
ncbi:MAG: hypothetical protein JW741_26335 [Sedimentisphaerales bacterium]|nr:hypothetical protein [Sedimentisphaerales bacterium]